MATREQEYSEVRRLMGYPKEQKPSPDLIVAGLIREEQFMMNLQNVSGKGWSPATTEFTSVVDTAEYSLDVTDFGKALFAYRVLDGNNIVPVKMADYVHALDNQFYEFIQTPPSSGVFPMISGERLAFFRDGSTPKVRIVPIPEDARVYKIVYATGALDWSAFEWSDVPFLPEWSHRKCLAVALGLMDEAEWDGLSFEKCQAKRAEKIKMLMPQYERQNAEFEPYLRNPVHEAMDSVGAWYEEA